MTVFNFKENFILEILGKKVYWKKHKDGFSLEWSESCLHGPSTNHYQRAETAEVTPHMARTYSRLDLIR